VAHPNAPLTPEGRRRLCERVDAGRAICHIAAEAGIARQTLGRWYARWTLEGEEGLQDRSSRPLHSPDQTPVEIEDRVEALRRERKVGPVQLVGTLAEALGVPGSGVSLRRGGRSRTKVFEVEGLDQRQAEMRLRATGDD